MTRQARTDLRERMERVAAKPAAHPDTPRRTRATRRSTTATQRTSGATRRRRATSSDSAHPTRSRVATLVAWAQWELMSVPRERLRYVRELVAGDGASGGANDDA